MNEPFERPSPDALLKRVNAERERARRAKLKIFFGFAPGVGKTYAMLESARRLSAQGVDVAIGCVETHGRGATEALLTGLDVLPRRIVQHRAAALEEFDLEAALARRPRVLLLDELAHTNAPGMRHKKRYQDVLDLLEAGIDVHTTLNVQHVESLNDVVAQITSVRVRETVPDAIIDRADEVELVDLPPDELLIRLQEGKVYLPEQAERAARNFFQRGNLIALRELALRRTADRVDADMQAYREEHEIEKTWAAGERILVCVGPGPGSARLVRAARRMAAGFRAPWVAAYVERAGGAPLAQHDRARLESHLRLAEALGGTVVHLSGATVSEALLSHARKHNVTRIILGKPTHPRWQDRFRGSLIEEVVRGSGDIDVQVISGDAGEPPFKAADERKVSGRVDSSGYYWALSAVAVATGLCALARFVLAAPDLVMIYLLAIMMVAVRFGRGAAFLAAALSVAGYDFFFVEPYYTFAVSDARNVLSFVMMFVVGLLLGGLTLRIRRQEQKAREREERTATLYALSRELGTAIDPYQVAAALARHAGAVFGRGAAVFVPTEQSEPMRLAMAGNIPWGATEDGVVRWVFAHGRAAGLGTDTLPGARVSCVPLNTGPNIRGALALEPASEAGLGFDERDFIEAFARQGALALERAELAEEAKAAALRARTEEMRSSLLSAVSHDLRTPLAAITGAASALHDETVSLSRAQRAELVDTICEEAERLERLLSNLLDMTRLESGALTVKREWVPIEELVSSALSRLESKLKGRPIEVDLPSSLPLIAVDPVLFEQVFINLLENIAKYTPVESLLRVCARAEDAGVAIEVSDRGPGLPVGSEEHIFEKFQRGSHVGIGGVGLGLPICRGIVEAHGGTILARNRSGGGAEFCISLPIVGRAPTMPEEAQEQSVASVGAEGQGP